VCSSLIFCTQLLCWYIPDKTGTITMNDMHIDVLAAGRAFCSVTGLRDTALQGLRWAKCAMRHVMRLHVPAKGALAKQHPTEHVAALCLVVAWTPGPLLAYEPACRTQQIFAQLSREVARYFCSNHTIALMLRGSMGIFCPLVR
jgi:hypothetical protein